MVAILIMYCMVVAVCVTAVMRLQSFTDSFLFVPTIVMLVLEGVAVIGLAVTWVKDSKEAKEKEDDE